MNHEVIDRDILIAFACGRLSREESLRVLAEIENDNTLSCELEEVLLVMRGVQDREQRREDTRRRALREPIMNYILRFAAILAFGIFAAVSVSELTKGKYYDLARTVDLDFSGRWRGDQDDQIERARREYAGGDRDGAIRELERVIRTRPGGESIAVVHSMVGAMILGTAERSFLGLFPRFDEKRVLQALEHLTLSMQSTNVRVVEEAHWLRMKGFLMLNKPQDAIREGEEVRDTRWRARS